MIEDFYTQYGEIQRAKRTVDGAGGITPEWLTIMTSKGVLDGISGSTGMYSEKMNADSTHVWICGIFELTMPDVDEQVSWFGAPFMVAPNGGIPTDIDEGDRMMINEVPYRITWLDNPMNYSRHLEIELKRWENDG